MKAAMLMMVAIALIVCAAPAFCQGGPGGHGGPGGPPPPPMAVQPPPPADRIDGIANDLNLTDDQVTALTALLTKIDAKVRPLMKAEQDSKKAVHEAFVSGDFDKAAGLASSATDAELAALKGGIAAWQQIKDSKILTDDQFAQLLAGPKHGPPPPPPGVGPR